jgi:hypothetical protein
VFAFLTVLRDYEMVCYYVLGLVALRYLYLFLSAQVRLTKSKFGLEHKLFAGQRNGAGGRLILILLAAAGVHLAVQYGLPEAERAERIRANAGAVELPTVIPSPTPFILFDVDVGGCVNPQATILEPKPGDAVSGPTDIRIVADIPNFAYFHLELGSPEAPDVWTTLFAASMDETPSAPDETAVPGLHLPATAEEPFVWTWNSATVTPGVYNLRLTVFAADEHFPPPCVVPIQVLAPSPG